MYRFVRILTQSNLDCCLCPGRIVKVHFGLYGEPDGGIIYYSFGEVFLTGKPDFEFEFVD